MDELLARVEKGAADNELARVVEWLRSRKSIEDTLGWSDYAADMLESGEHRRKREPCPAGERGAEPTARDHTLSGDCDEIPF